MPSNSGPTSYSHRGGQFSIPTALNHRAEACTNKSHGIEPLLVRQNPVAEQSSRSPVRNDLVIGKNIRELRRAKSLTQKDVANMVGVTGAQFHRYESGATRIAASRLMTIAHALEVTVNALMKSPGSERGPTIQPVAEQLGRDCRADEIAELITTYCSISDVTDRRTILTLGRMLAEKSIESNKTTAID